MENSCFKTKNFLMNSLEVSNWLFYLFLWKMTHTGELDIKCKINKKSYNLKLQNMI